MLNRLFLLFLYSFPLLLFGQYESWLDGTRTRFKHGYGPFMTAPLWSTYLGAERWEPGDTKDLQWAIGGRISFIDDDRPEDERFFQVGDRDFRESWVLSLSYTVAANFLYVHAESQNFSGRLRLEVPVELHAVFGGGEKLEKVLPILEDGRIVGEVPIWHKENPVLFRPSLGINLVYSHSLSPNISFGFQQGIIGAMGIGVHMKAGFFLEIRHRTNH